MHSINLFEDEGWLNIPLILSYYKTTFIAIIGGRGIGKTYGAVKYWWDKKLYAMFLRRSQTQLETLMVGDLSPFDNYAKDSGKEYAMSSKAKNLYQVEVEGEKRGYAAAMSTFANLRGFSARDIDIIIYDEFIKEAHEKRLKNEAFAFYNIYETINRNRGMEGFAPPVRVLLLSNSNELGNPLFIDLKVVTPLVKCIARGQQVYVNKNLDLTVINLDITPIGEKKKDTPLYRLTRYSSFSGMSLYNEYLGEDYRNERSVNLKACNIDCVFGEIAIYEYKRGFYFSSHISGNPERYELYHNDIERFKMDKSYIIRAHISLDCYYETHYLKILFDKYLKENYN